MTTLDKTMQDEPFCIKSTCISCKKFQNNDDNIKFEGYHVCNRCFINSDCNVELFRNMYYNLLETDDSDIKSLYWIKCKCKKIFEFEISGLKRIGVLDYNQIICDCQGQSQKK